VFAALALFAAACGTDAATENATACAQSDLIAQCPAGSDPVLGSEASQTCSGEVDLSTGVVDQGGSAVGQCQGSGSCQVFCQFAAPCTCGVAEVSREAVICAECPDQSCGDGRCEGTERQACAVGQEGCFECSEDCSGATCGDGDCTAAESPETCPVDCASGCTPNSTTCVANSVRICAADGSGYTETDCTLAGMVCQGGTCVVAGACGNDVCETGETPVNCAADCASTCVLGSTWCAGEDVMRCPDSGVPSLEVECDASGLICVSGECLEGDVCGNGRCELPETPESCSDCAVTCGDGTCGSGERATCPRDCGVCGNSTCESGEQDSCPQDCGICVPSSRTCVGSVLVVCAANGQSAREADCAESEGLCARGECVVAGVCGNGACEVGDDVSCPTDCAEVCGNTVCGPGEQFSNCAEDCDPRCGDGSCDAPYESNAACPRDCAGTCGNGTCDAAETRASCSADCGFCGDGACQDGFETPGPSTDDLESCRIDCVVFGCERHADCNDRIDCTEDRCVDGACVYQPDDLLCDDDQRCLERAGCCEDFDSDTFTDVACGGSDCDDREFAVRPGAPEVCGGGDRNCDGLHRPALTTPTQVTTSRHSKFTLAVASDGARFMLFWLAAPDGPSRLFVQEANQDGVLQGSPLPIDVTNLPRESTSDYPVARALYNPASARFAFAWPNDVWPNGFLLYSATSGLIGEPIVFDDAALSMFTWPIQLAMLGNQYFVNGSNQTCGTAGCGQAGRGRLITDALGVSSPGGISTPGPAMFAVPRNGSSPETLISIEATGNNISVISPTGVGLSTNTCDPTMNLWGALPQIFVDEQDDGPLVVVAATRSPGVELMGYGLSGDQLVSEMLTDEAVTLVDAHLDDAANLIAVLTTDGTNLYFGVASTLDGALTLPFGIVASGEDLRDAQIVRDSRGYTIFWTQAVGAVRQVFMTRVSCT
jgi:hypothetical protein